MSEHPMPPLPWGGYWFWRLIVPPAIEEYLCREAQSYIEKEIQRITDNRRTEAVKCPSGALRISE